MSPSTLPPLQHDPAAGHPLVDTAEGLTPAWLTSVLRARGLLHAASVTGVSTRPIGNGMLGLNLRLTLEYDRSEPGAPATLVAKLASLRAESRESGAALQLYTRETRFYQLIAPRIGSCLARILFADVSEDGRRFCLLFEDLAPARSGDQLLGCDLHDAEAAMRAAAALHAPMWNDRDVLAQPWIDRSMMTQMYRAKVPASTRMVQQRFAHLLEPGVAEVMLAFADAIDRYFERHDTPWTISHQDYRLDNVLFDARSGKEPVAVLDWQTFVPGPGALDASYFNGAGLLAPLRREHEVSLARLYHRELLARGVEGYSWDRCWHDYRLHAGHGVIMGIVGAAITAPTERGDRMLSTMINRHALQMIDLDTLSLIRKTR